MLAIVPGILVATRIGCLRAGVRQRKPDLGWSAIWRRWPWQLAGLVLDAPHVRQQTLPWVVDRTLQLGWRAAPVVLLPIAPAGSILSRHLRTTFLQQSGIPATGTVIKELTSPRATGST